MFSSRNIDLMRALCKKYQLNDFMLSNDTSSGIEFIIERNEPDISNKEKSQFKAELCETLGIKKDDDIEKVHLEIYGTLEKEFAEFKKNNSISIQHEDINTLLKILSGNAEEKTDKRVGAGAACEIDTTHHHTSAFKRNR